MIFYRNLEEDSIINCNQLGGRIEIKEQLGELVDRCYNLHLSGPLYPMYLCYLIASDENAFSLSSEKGKVDEGLKALALEDIKALVGLIKNDYYQVTTTQKGNYPALEVLYHILIKEQSEKALLEALMDYYKTYGVGMMNRYKAFKWDHEKGLIGISNCDSITLKDLVGCDSQKEALVKNTENFIQGKPANNALLFGDSGTGKSSSVKALLNAYSNQGLRIIEVTKSEFKDFNLILKLLKHRGLKFIIFLDDLSFEEFEVEYKYMKALIEGGIEVRPKNVILYATSNRRHLIRETWDEREGQDVHIAENRHEKLSLSDRFGLTLTFTSPNQELYLKMVQALAKRYELEMDEQVLRAKAIQWELIHSGRSGRAAEQFVLSLL